MVFQARVPPKVFLKVACQQVFHAVHYHLHFCILAALVAAKAPVRGKLKVAPAAQAALQAKRAVAILQAVHH